MPSEYQLPLDLFGDVPPPPGRDLPPAHRPLVPGEALTRDARRRLDTLARSEPAIRTLAPEVHVVWNPRLQNTAGRAYYQTSRIELNPRLAGVSDPTEIERTLLHELAHLLSYHRSRTKRDGSPLSRPKKISAHGPEWKRACADLGIPGEQRTHNLELAPRRQVKPRHAYVCNHCGEVLLRVRPLRHRSACYPCCKTHSSGQFDTRFELLPIPLEQAEATLAARENGAG